MKNRLSRLMDARAENVIDTPRVNFSFFPQNEHFPMILSPAQSDLILRQWMKENKSDFFNKLNTHGALLLREFQIDTVEKFKELIGVFDSPPLEYKQRSSPRFAVAENIYHSTTYPADQSINMHSENSYAKNRARRIVFCCIQPAEEQGETPIADNRLVIQYLSAETRSKFQQKGVKYVRNISKGGGLSWQEVFQTDNKAEVEKECTANEMDIRWEGDDRLVLSWTNDAICRHPDTNEEIWFNHAFFFNRYALSEEVLSAVGSDDELPFNTYFGDGSIIERHEIEEIRSAYRKATFIFPWKKGDVLFLDNMLMAHGRQPYKGDRKIIVSMF